jgi:anion-transporting  ArsA/GET3 family ATPase
MGEVMADKSGKRPPDPAENFRNLVNEWERGFDAMANRFMGTDEFSRSMNQLQDLQLSMQKHFNEAMAEQLSNFNIPSRDDILQLGEAVHALDKRVARVESLLVKQAKKKKKKSKASARSGPPRTKQPPSARQEAGDG